MSEAFVVAARRTPIGRVGGVLRNLRVESLAAPVMRAVLADAGLAAGDVDDVVLGNVWGPGGNPARVAALTAGLDPSVPGLTVDRQCASGLEAVNLAARLVRDGAADVCLAGGVESVSTAPWRIDRPATLYQTPAFSNRARFAPDDAGDPEMGPAADALARTFGVSRARQDQFAIDSHRKATAAAQGGRFDGEIVPLPASNRAAAEPPPPEGWDDPITRDQSPRSGLTLRRLARFPPVFTPDGTVTAGNSSPINDGAAIVVVVSDAVHQRLGCPAALRVVDGVAAGVDPAMPGAGPIAATQALCKRVANIDLGDVDLVELTEAFAGQALACVDALGIAEERLNVAGGAIALGHPWGASGAVLVTRLFTEMVRSPSRVRASASEPVGGDPIASPAPRHGLATVAGAGGLGVATLFERWISQAPGAALRRSR